MQGDGSFHTKPLRNLQCTPRPGGEGGRHTVGGLAHQFANTAQTFGVCVGASVVVENVVFFVVSTITSLQKRNKVLYSKLAEAFVLQKGFFFWKTTVKVLCCNGVKVCESGC